MKCFLMDDFDIDLQKVNDLSNTFLKFMFSSSFYLIITKQE